ncbi:Glucan endo-1,3-beta-glucosidase [Quillaja saponaria]|uniref:glucan endo-1,3-beta-D-glucosidase n=1 Tax=Quillaja saponaria TaxID=32244 RepID=A0AAD7PQE2_QUISA|nr:Glucan endo-1,3-beta-glucosidase [Quillaja saponaria]
MSLRFSNFFMSLIFSLYFISLLPRSTSFSTIGVTYSAAANTHLPPEHIATAINCLNITSLRLQDSDPNVIRAFTYTNISLFLTIPNSLVPTIASNRTNALRWLYVNVVPFYPRAKITIISVGNDILEVSPEFAELLVPAIRNVYLALGDLGIRKISVSTTFSFINVITTPFPPSAAKFQDSSGDNVILPLLQFLRETNSSFLMNVYPYNLFRLNSEIPIGIALFKEHPFNFRDDLTTGVRYHNLFDMMIDAVISAMAVEGHEDIPIIVSETGWPSSSTSPYEVDANIAYAEMYLKALVGHLKSGLGTPLRMEGVAETYIYELFDTESKQETKQTIRKWGILYPNMTRKYNINFSGSARIGRSRVMVKLAIGIFLVFVLCFSQ